jgi:hypothetical protein
MLLPMRLCSGRCEGVRAVVAQPRLCERRGGCSAWCAVLDVRYEAAVSGVDIGLYDGLPVLLSPQSASVESLLRAVPSSYDDWARQGNRTVLEDA